MIGLGEVVIVPGNPEHGNHRHTAVALQALRQCDGGERLVDRVQGAGEQPGLLPGGDAQHFTGGEPLAPRAGKTGGEDVRSDAPRLAGGRPRRRRADRGGDDAGNHERAPTRIARGASVVSGRPS